MLNEATNQILIAIKEELDGNGGKLSPKFIGWYAEKCTYEYSKTGNSCRTCVLTTTNGNKIVESALVLDPENDIEEIGNKVARDKCVNQLWSFLGGLSKALA